MILSDCLFFLQFQGITNDFSKLTSETICSQRVHTPSTTLVSCVQHLNRIKNYSLCSFRICSYISWFWFFFQDSPRFLEINYILKTVVSLALWRVTEQLLNIFRTHLTWLIQRWNPFFKYIYISFERYADFNIRWFFVIFSVFIYTQELK